MKRGEAWLRKGMTEENLDLAIADYQRAVEADPSNALARQMLANALNYRQVLPGLRRAFEEHKATEERRKAEAAGQKEGK
jgi:hypothetical protein